MRILPLFVVIIWICIDLSTSEPTCEGVSIAFPERWDGDNYQNYPCVAENIPPWLDGFFLSQLSASYGNQSGPDGEKLVHMFDGIGAIASFNLMKGEVYYTAAYYPWSAFDIWDWYGRDFTKSKIAWYGNSPYNVNASKKWEKPVRDGEKFPVNPNVDFWLIGTKVIGGTEVSNVGFYFDPITLSDFNLNYFDDQSDEFTNGQYQMISQPIHARMDAEGNLWNTIIALDVTARSQHQIVYTISSEGVRLVQGRYDFGAFDPNQCIGTAYNGSKTIFGGYMHSITSTENYIILPMSSSIFDTCAMLNENDTVIDGVGYPGETPYDPNVNLRFLLFNKKTKQFTMIPHDRHFFITHQFNAYETDSGTIYADMLAYDDAGPYNKYLKLDYLQNNVFSNGTHPIRFIILPENNIVVAVPLLPEPIGLEFSQFNHRYTSKKYRYGYAVMYPYAFGSQIIKVDMDDKSGNSSKIFKPRQASASVAEPIFVPRPGATDEDDGVLLIRGLDAGMGVMYVVDAKTMEQIGAAEAPDLIPFGFHSRYFSREQLQLPPTPDKTTTALTTTATSETSTDTATTAIVTSSETPTTTEISAITEAASTGATSAPITEVSSSATNTVEPITETISETISTNTATADRPTTSAAATSETSETDLASTTIAVTTMTPTTEANETTSASANEIVTTASATTAAGETTIISTTTSAPTTETLATTEAISTGIITAPTTEPSSSPTVTVEPITVTTSEAVSTNTATADGSTRAAATNEADETNSTGTTVAATTMTLSTEVNEAISTNASETVTTAAITNPSTATTIFFNEVTATTAPFIITIATTTAPSATATANETSIATNNNTETTYQSATTAAANNTNSVNEMPTTAAGTNTSSTELNVTSEVASVNDTVTTVLITNSPTSTIVAGITVTTFAATEASTLTATMNLQNSTVTFTDLETSEATNASEGVITENATTEVCVTAFTGTTANGETVTAVTIIHPYTVEETVTNTIVTDATNDTSTVVSITMATTTEETATRNETEVSIDDSSTSAVTVPSSELTFASGLFTTSIETLATTANEISTAEATTDMSSSHIASETITTVTATGSEITTSSALVTADTSVTGTASQTSPMAIITDTSNMETMVTSATSTTAVPSTSEINFVSETITATSATAPTTTAPTTNEVTAFTITATVAAIASTEEVGQPQMRADAEKGIKINFIPVFIPTLLCVALR